MTWHYAAGGVQHGPVDDASLDRLVASGEVTPDTLVWRPGMAAWAPLREARPAVPLPEALVQAGSAATGGPGSAPAPAPAAAPAPDPVPSHAAAPQPTIDPEAAYARIVAEGRRIQVFDSLRRGWELVFAQPGESIGVSALILLTMIGAGLLPCVGAIGQLVATGPLVGAWFLYFLERMRGRPTEWGDAWAGFSSPMLLQLVLGYLVQTAAVFLVLIPVLAGFFVLTFGAVATAAAAERMAPLALVPVLGLLVVAACVIVYLTLAWIFALPLIIDRQLPFWPAMKLSWRVAHQQFLPLLGLYLMCGLVYVAGFLALCVGILIALPVCMAALSYAYEDLFGEPSPA